MLKENIRVNGKDRPKKEGTTDTPHQKQKLRKGSKRRKPKISHLKQDLRLSRNYYRGIFGDNINVMLAAATINFKQMMNKWKKFNRFKSNRTAGDKLYLNPFYLGDTKVLSYNQTAYWQ